MYKPTVAGTYSYVCTFHASSGMTGTFTVTGSSHVNTVNRGPALSLFPNPASEVINVQFGVAGIPFSVQLASLDGRVVFSSQYNSSVDAMVDLHNIPAGTYILSAFQGDLADRQEIVVTH
jgi:hypothetical protein